MRRAGAAVLLSTLGTAGCGGAMSMLGVQNPAGARIELLWWVMLGTTGVLSSVVFVALALALRRARARGRAAAGQPDGDAVAEAGGGADRAPAGRATDGERSAVELDRDGRLFLALGGLVPLIFLGGLLVLSVRIGAALAPPDDATRTVEVIGHQFWWEVRYPDEGVVTANEIHIPTGERVRVVVRSADVIHSFWVPALGPGKIDMVPGRTNLTWLYAAEPGRYRGQCTEFCGTQHALMSLLVFASHPDDFERWLDARRDRAPEVPADPERRLGLSLFFERGCAVCHGVGPTTGGPASPVDVGPDLGDLGTRATLGALTVENTPENLADWIVDPHRVKPGVRMPPTPGLDDEALQALVAYLTGLVP